MRRMLEPPPQPWWGEVAAPKEQLARDLYFRGLERFGPPSLRPVPGGDPAMHRSAEPLEVEYDTAEHPVDVMRGSKKSKKKKEKKEKKEKEEPTGPKHTMKLTTSGYVGKIRNMASPDAIADAEDGSPRQFGTIDHQ